MPMVLSDRTIKEELAKGHIVIEPLGERCIQPASVDLRIDRQIRTFLAPEQYSLVDVRTDLDGITQLAEIPDPLPYILEPGQFILANTIENVQVPDDLVARLEGKSSLGRLGLMVHATAGYVDPGFKGQLTLEMSNVARARIAIFFGMKVVQISFLRLSTPADHPYGSDVLGSKYQGQLGPTPSRVHLDFETRSAQQRQYPSEPTELRRWLDKSEYEGSVVKLARVLAVEHKTVQDWVYGRNEPSVENRIKLFEVTGLSRYAHEPGASQPRLFTDEQAQAEMASTSLEDA